MPLTHPAPRRALRAVLTLLLAAIAVASLGAATASARPTFGYGEGRAEMFSDERFLALPLRDVRRLVDWDVQRYPAKIAALDTWMEAARSTNSRPLIAIDRSWTAGRAKTKPTIAQYTALISWLRIRYPYFNRLTPWNEANFRDQPTAKNPKLAWQYYVAAKSACAGCTVTSPVVLAGKSVSKTWLTQFKRYERGRIKIWAVHNYGDANRGENTGLKWVERQVKGRIWITEAAGWVQFLGGKYAYDERRAANAITRVIKTAKADKRIDFVYFYQWRGTDDRNVRWDSGVLNEDGSPRLGYHALVRGLKG